MAWSTTSRHARGYLHPNLAGNRLMGTRMDALMADSTAPSLSSLPSTLQVNGGAKLARPLASDEYVSWSLAGPDAAKFEVAENITPNGLGGGVQSYTLRWAGDGTKAYGQNDDAGGDGVYNVSVVARDGRGNVTTKPVQVSVAAPYGVGDQGPTTMTVGATGNFGSNYGGTVNGVALKKGLNLVHLTCDGGADQGGLTLNNIAATRIMGNLYQGIWAVVLPEEAR